MILHKKCFILRQNSKKKFWKYPKSSKVYKRCQILNCLEFNNYWFLLHKINFHWRISMPRNIFSLEVFDFGVSRYCIFEMRWSNHVSNRLISLDEKHIHSDDQNVNMAVEALCLGRRQNRALWLEGFPARVGHKLQFFPKIREPSTHNIMTTAHFSTLLHMLYFSWVMISK